MIINNAPQNEAIMSNVAEIGEFRIRNSAKAFNILSSGLYANKIRAIIRELSCNAVDSHVAAGKADTPFDVHLPNQLEPWFSIRDYGTGLTHDQVTNIYTTYFESTKTDSNAFIGALGLGSKSPFSYTDNFTVTAVKDGKKGVYSAFINEAGVPSIALMMTEESTDPSGVEVKFSVNDQYDFSKFRDEARTVYTYFKLRPVVTGYKDFEIRDVEYETRDIIPGVHSVVSRYDSRAVMGNIAYPIDVPNADKNLGSLAKLLNCGLELNFGIGELDFQASREGLSYIPQTVNAIKAKLEAVNAELATHVAKEAEAITNKWDRALFLMNKARRELWANAVEKYVTDTNNVFFKKRHNYLELRDFEIRTNDLSNRYNIQVRAFSKHTHYDSTSNINSTTVKDATPDANGNPVYQSAWAFGIGAGVRFVVNDTNVGATERAKYHVRTAGLKQTVTVYVLEPADRKKPMNTKAFFRAIKNPPEASIWLASTLAEKPRAAPTGTRMAKNVTILQLEERGRGGYYRSQDYVWRDAGKADEFDSKTVHYYIPLSGYNIENERIKNSFSAKQLMNVLSSSGIEKLNNIPIYGVRKTDIEFIKTQLNWVELDTHIAATLLALTTQEIKSLVMGSIDSRRFLQYNPNIVKAVNPKSPYAVAANTLKNAAKQECDMYSLKTLFKVYDYALDFEPVIDALTAEHEAVITRYPLISRLSYSVDDADVVEYINLIDANKGI